LHLFNIPLWALVAYGVVVGLFALWRGGWSERAVAAALLVEFILEPRLVFLSWRLPSWFIPGWDVVILATCVACALRGRRYWTIAASSFALLEVVTTLLRFVPGVGTWAYMSAERVWTILLVATLAVGAGAAGYRPPRPASVNA